MKKLLYFLNIFYIISFLTLSGVSKKKKIKKIKRNLLKKNIKSNRIFSYRSPIIQKIENIEGNALEKEYEEIDIDKINNDIETINDIKILQKYEENLKEYIEENKNTIELYLTTLIKIQNKIKKIEEIKELEIKNESKIKNLKKESEIYESQIHQEENN